MLAYIHAIRDTHFLNLPGGQVNAQYSHGLCELALIDGAAIVRIDLGEDFFDQTRRLRT